MNLREACPAVRNRDCPLSMITSRTYCWWLKSCTTWDKKNRVNNGINYQPQLVIAGFLNHQQYHDTWQNSLQRYVIRSSNDNTPLAPAPCWTTFAVAFLLHQGPSAIASSPEMMAKIDRSSHLLPGKLTCPLKINGWKMYFLLKYSNFWVENVRFRWCKSIYSNMLIICLSRPDPHFSSLDRIEACRMGFCCSCVCLQMPGKKTRKNMKKEI